MFPHLHFYYKNKTGKIYWRAFILLVLAISILAGQLNLYSYSAHAQTSLPAAQDWPMAGANLERTSAVSEGVGGLLAARWVRPIQPYISQKVQIIAAGGLVFVSTSGGLYALDAETGADVWVYPTDMPLGHSPTVSGGVVYVGGFDRMLHALSATTGGLLWTFEAEAGFQTNPLVVNGAVYAGNRDGHMYAMSATDGRLLWKFKTDGPILFSAAYKDGVIFFAANDSHAYALRATDGSLVWKSDQLPGMGFHSYWPVIYQDYVILAGSAAFDGKMHSAERDDLFPHWETDPDGTLIGPLGAAPGAWVAGMPTINTSRPNDIGSSNPVTAYFAEKPWRRTMFVLDRQSGKEVTFDFDGDGQADYIPALWAGTTGSGNRYPPVVGNDNVLYFRNNYMSDGHIAGGGITGWTPGSPFISLPQSRELGGNGDWPVDEPGAYAIGGQFLYHSLCCDRVIGAIDLSAPNPWPPPAQVSARPDNPRQWRYDQWKLPGYDSQLEPYLWFPGQTAADGELYFAHGDQNAPVPYGGLVYLHRSNAVIALGPGDPGATLPVAPVVTSEQNVAPPPVAVVRELLVAEVQKMVDAGHLRPGYSSLGLHNHSLTQLEPAILDYFHDPAETIVVLLRALPYLPPELQSRTQGYVQALFNNFPPYAVTHVGWSEGQPRDPFALPERGRGGWNGRQTGTTPLSYYALWQYAQAFGGAPEIFDQSRQGLPAAPPDAELAWNPHRHNALIAGYLGYLELENLAGYPESNEVRQELERLLSLRAETFTADLVHPDPRTAAGKYYYTLLISWNFMNLTPELADYLHLHASEKVAQAVEQYEQMAPYWFVAKAEEVQGEGVLSPLYHYHGLFQAKALILHQPYEELAIYLDIPAFTTGDLFYIDNLVAALEAAPASPPAISEASQPTSEPLPLVPTLPSLPVEGGETEDLAIPAAPAEPALPYWEWIVILFLFASGGVIGYALFRAKGATYHRKDHDFE